MHLFSVLFKIEVHAIPRIQPVAMLSDEPCKYLMETERNLDKPSRKSVNLEKFKKLDYAIAKQSLNTDLILRAKVLDAMAELKSGNYRLCNDCIHHTVKHDEKEVNGCCGRKAVDGESKVRYSRCLLTDGGSSQVGATEPSWLRKKCNHPSSL